MQQIAGFGHQGIGPRDSQNQQALGAKRYISGKAQVSFAINEEKILNPKIVFFTEAASSFCIDIPDKSSLSKNDYHDDHYFRVSCGLGVIVDLPVGTLRLFFARPLRSKSYDKKEMFRFTLGKTSHF